MAAFFNYRNMRIRLTIKAIVRWEQLTGRSFSSLDYGDSEDVEKLLYTAMLCSGEKVCTLEVFRAAIKNERLLGGFVKDLERAGKVVAQFQRAEQGKAGPAGNEEPGFVKDIVHTLILEGVNPGYVLNEMEICDLPELIAAYERKKKEMMEAGRLWTFFNILPHVDGSKIKSPSDMYPFPWEEEASQENEEDIINDNKDLFEKFLEHQKSDFVQ